MAERHFERLARSVKLGGRKLGPLTFGGCRYLVEPMSVQRFAQFLRVTAASGIDAADIFGSHSMLIVRGLAPAIVSGLLRDCDRHRASNEQLAALLLAWSQVNDLDYIFKAFTPGKPNQPIKQSETLEALVCWLAAEYGVMPREVWRMPVQEALATSEALAAARKAGTPADLPVGARGLTDEEQRQLGAEIKAAGGSVVLQ